MKRATLLLCCALGLFNCATLKAAASGDVKGAAAAAAEEAAAAAKKIQDAKAKADADCKPLNDRVGNVDGDDAAKAAALEDAKKKGYGVSWPEERAIGGAIAIGFGKTGKGLFIDITDKDPVPLQKKAEKDRKLVKLTPSQKNDLNMYIQLVGDHVATGSTRPGIAWTFGVIENDTPNAVSTPGGYVLVTTGLLKLIDNEAQLAGVLGHEIGHVTGRHAIHSYANAKATSCNIAVTGYYLVEAGASNVPGGEEFVKNAKFGKTMKAFARPEGVDVDKDPEVDGAFMQWFINRVIDFQNLKGNAEEDEFDADKTAFELMAAAGYDTKEYDKLIDKIPNSLGAFSHHPSNAKRIEALQKLRGEGDFGAEGGKAPAIPANANWPAKPAS